ncbi:MAG: hypothetical protein N2169_07950 [bacterium]|nr:hypothetical protein [bacterium]
MEYKFSTSLNSNELYTTINKNADISFINKLIGTGNLIAKFKKNGQIILMTKTRNSFKKNFYFKIVEDDNQTFIIGSFRFNIFSKVFFILSVLTVLIGILLTFVCIIKNKDDYILYIFLLIFLLLLALIEIIIYLKRHSLGKKDMRIIYQFLEDILKAKKIY